MRLRIGSVLVALATVVWMTTVCLAQADNTSSPTDEAAQVETTAAPPDMDQAAVISELFLTLVSPADRDVELPLETAQLRIHGATLPGAVVSIVSPRGPASGDQAGGQVTVLTHVATRPEVPSPPRRNSTTM